MWSVFTGMITQSLSLLPTSLLKLVPLSTPTQLLPLLHLSLSHTHPKQLFLYLTTMGCILRQRMTLLRFSWDKYSPQTTLTALSLDSINSISIYLPLSLRLEVAQWLYMLQFQESAHQSLFNLLSIMYTLKLLLPHLSPPFQIWPTGLSILPELPPPLI